MATPADLRDAVVAAIAAAMPAGVVVEAHGGTFDEAEIKRYATRAPAVLVADLGFRHEQRWQDGRWLVPVRFAAVIVTRDTIAAGAKAPRDAAAQNLAAAVSLVIAGNRFGIEGVFQPAGVDGRNEYSGTVDKTGVAMWQVTWTSAMLLGAPAGEAIDSVIAALTEGVVNGSPEWTAAGGLASPPVDYPLPDPAVAAPAFPLRQDEALYDGEEGS